MKSELYNGDVLEIIEKLDIDWDKTVIVTDPPFNIGYHYNQYKDDLKESDYYKWLNDILRDRMSVVIHYPEKMYKLSFQMENFPEKVISWVYNSNTAKQHRDIAFFNVKPDFRKVGQPYKNPKDKRIAKRIAEGKKARLYDWWNINQVKNVSKDKTEHPCQMPQEVMDRIVGILPEDITVLDPFMGSGTTGMACKKLGVNFIGIELDEKYFNIAKDRIQSV